MRRLIISGPRQAAFEDVPIPACPPDGVLVRAQLTAISPGTELRVYRAVPVDPEGRFLHEHVPFRLPTENGYSMVGEVIEVGPDVPGAAGLTVGGRVFVPAPHRQVAAVPASQVVPLPEGVSDEHAVLLNILEVAHIAVRRADPAPGEDVAVVGGGIVGLSVLAWCRAFGFRTALLEPDEGRRRVAERMGALLAVAPGEDGTARVVELFGGEGADAVFEAGSNWEAVRAGLRVARVDGRVVIVSRHTQTPDYNPLGHPFLGKRLRLITSYGYPPPGHRWDRRRSIALALDFLSRGLLPVDPLLTHRFDWADLPDVYRRLDEGDRGIIGAVLRW